MHHVLDGSDEPLRHIRVRERRDVIDALLLKEVFDHRFERSVVVAIYWHGEAHLFKTLLQTFQYAFSVLVFHGDYVSQFAEDVYHD